MKTCINCGREMPDDVSICPACGAASNRKYMSEAERFLYSRLQSQPSPDASNPDTGHSSAFRQDTRHAPSRAGTPWQSCAVDATPQTASRSQASTSGRDMNGPPGYFSLSGRIGRKTYFLRLLAIYGILLGLYIAICFCLGAGMQIGGEWNESTIGLVTKWVLGCLSLFVAPFIIPQHTKRLHDIGTSGWSMLFFGVPLIGWIFFLVLLFLPGKHGPNKYGADPRNCKG